MRNYITEDMQVDMSIAFSVMLEGVSLENTNFRDFLSECYTDGVAHGTLINEGFFDRLSANMSRLGNHVKSLNSFNPNSTNAPTGVDSAINARFDKFKGVYDQTRIKKTSSGSPTNNTAIAASLGNFVRSNVSKIASKSATAQSPAPTPSQAATIIANSNAPVTLKAKIANAIRENPAKTGFLLGILAFGAGVALSFMGGAAATTKVTNAIIDGLGNAAVANIKGTSADTAAIQSVNNSVANADLSDFDPLAYNTINTNANIGMANAEKVIKGTSETPSAPTVNVNSPVVGNVDANPKDFNLKFDDFGDTSAKKTPSVKKFKHALTPPEARVASDRKNRVIKENDSFILSEARITSQQTLLFNDFLDDLIKLLSLKLQPDVEGRHKLIKFLYDSAPRFDHILAYLDKNKLLTDYKATKIDITTAININREVDALLDNLTIVNPTQIKAFDANQTQHISGKNPGSYVFKLYNNNNVSFMIKGLVGGKILFTFSEYAQDALKNANKVLVKEVNTTSVSGLKPRFIKELAHSLAVLLNTPDKVTDSAVQYESYLASSLPKNQKFRSLFVNINSVLVSSGKILNTLKLPYIWIGINGKGIRFYSGVIAKKEKTVIPKDASVKTVRRNNLNYALYKGDWYFIPKKGDPKRVFSNSIINDLNKIADSLYKEKSKFDDLGIKRATADKPAPGVKISKDKTIGFDSSRFEENSKI